MRRIVLVLLGFGLLAAAAAIAAELSPEEQETLVAAVPLLRRLSGH